MFGASGGRAKAERKSGAKEEAGPGGGGGGGGGGGAGGRVELLVFGYACKLFRDDERALALEQGQHLIPWMGDHKILIDRYDGRGHLHDLSEYDAEHSTWNRDYQLSEEEARIEALCDEERYLALHTDLLEEEARQEEEYKRLSEALAEDGTYNAVGLTYGSDYYDPSEPTEEEPSGQREKGEADHAEENEEPFIAPAGLAVPPDVELPPTAKMHAIIERTARFVCRQGAQFEIMLKARQARNSQFDFLRFDHYLNPYYKFIQKATKEGRYPALAESRGDGKQKSGVSSDEDEDEDDGSYLHPSLFASKKRDRLEELVKPLKVVDPDHPLAMLVRKAQADSPAPTPSSAEGAAGQPSQVEYTSDSTVAAMYYSYYMLPDGTYCLAPPPPGVDVATYYSTLPAAVAVPSTAGVTATAPPPPGTTPPPPPTTAETSSGVTSTTITTSALAPVAAIIPPPPDIQPVIDKLAEYVARNGLKFETSVRAKNDQRFEFLQPWHQYNPYYEFKKQFFLQKEGGDGAQAVPAPEEAPTEAAPERPSDPGEEGAAEDPADPGGRGGPGGKKESASGKAAPDGKLVKASFAPISFAIKAKENDLLPLEKNRVRLDDSDEDAESREGPEGAGAAPSADPAAAPPCAGAEEKRPPLTQEELEAKQAKQKLEDRLAAAAREKLAQASKESKEKQLQAERKRKAALFLQTLRNPAPEAELGKAEEGPFPAEEASPAACPPLSGGRPLPAADMRPPEGPAGRSRDPPREEEREKKKKKHKKRSRTRSRSPKYHSSKSRSRSHSKAKHALPSAYRTARRSRSRSRSPRRRAHSPERRREERSVPTAYRVSNSPGASRKRTRSRSPHEKKKKRRSRSRTKSKAESRPASPSKQAPRRHSAHSASISPVESRGSSPERSRAVSQEKEGHISSAIVSSVQSKITQDLMAKVRAMLAASKNMQTSAS